jgi:hypothetical protein
MARVLGLKQLISKRFKFLKLPPHLINTVGFLTENFWMIVWGKSGNGKTNFNIDFLRAILDNGNALYVSLEEGTESTMVINAMKYFNEKEHSGKIQFADHEMTVDELIKKLNKKKSPKYIVIDSIQHWNIKLDDYWRLKELFKKKKTFIFISHAKGKDPEGFVADKIRYDVGVKIHIEGFVATPKMSRYGGNNPHIIWEQGAKNYWGKQYKKVTEQKYPTPKIEDIESLVRLEPEFKSEEIVP